MEETSPQPDPRPQQIDGRKRPRKLIVSLTLAPIIAMTAAANVANAFFPTLLDEQPLTLIAFDARARNLLLVAANVTFTAWFVIALIRRTIFHPLYFLLGRWYGDAAVRWISKRSPDVATLLTTVEGWFPRRGWLIVTVYSHPLICVLAGASKMRMSMFVFYNVFGNVVSLLLLWKLGDIAHTPLEAAGGFIGRYSLPLTIVTFVLVAFYMTRGNNNGSGIEGVGHIEKELEQEERKVVDTTDGER